MSNHLISMAYKRDLRSITRKALLVLMADKASDDGSGIWASKPTMADELCTSKPTIIRTLQSFIDDGLVREVGKRKNSHGYTVEYSIVVSALEALPLVNCHRHNRSRKFTGHTMLPVKECDPSSNTVLPDRSQGVTQTLPQPPNNRNRARAPAEKRLRSSDKLREISVSQALAAATPTFRLRFDDCGYSGWRAMEETACFVAAENGITQQSWQAMCRRWSPEVAALTILLIDRNAHLPNGHRYRAEHFGKCFAGLSRDPSSIVRLIKAALGFAEGDWIDRQFEPGSQSRDDRQRIGNLLPDLLAKFERLEAADASE